MGNCIEGMFSTPKNKDMFPTFDGGEDLKASTMVKKSTSGHKKGYDFVHLPFPPKNKLKSGEVYCFMPQQQKMADEDSDSCRSRKVKIVVTKHQLEMLLKSVQLQGIGNTSWDVEGFGKWKPSLATILE